MGGESEVSLYPHLRFTVQVYVTGWRVRGESVPASTLHCAGLRDRVESQR